MPINRTAGAVIRRFGLLFYSRSTTSLYRETTIMDTNKPPSFVEHEGKKVFLNTRLANEELPKGYEEWVKWMREENKVFVSCLEIYKGDLK